MTSFVALAAISLCFGGLAQAQFGGLQVQVGGYGSGVRIGGMGYGNNYYGNSYGYGNGYGNRYGSGYGYGNGYGNSYHSSYGNYRQPGTIYLNGGNSFGYRSYPNYSYGASRYYSPPVRRYAQRRFR